MITIHQSKAGSKPELVSLETTLTTPGNVYAISSDGPMIESQSSYDGALFGAISWPVSRFRVAEGLLLEQQMFLPHDGSAVAVSWALRGNTTVAAQLVVRPFFSGCGPRSYRDIGFHFESNDNLGRLTWLPHVRGPRVFADTNGRYVDEPVRLFDCLCEEAAASASTEDLITPGRFEFQLSRRPAVLILSVEHLATTQHNQHIGAFRGWPDARKNPSTSQFDCPREHWGQNSAAGDRVISSQTYFGLSANAAKHISRALRFSLRCNKKIKHALRAAYRKFDPAAETERLLRKHLPR